MKYNVCFTICVPDRMVKASNNIIYDTFSVESSDMASLLYGLINRFPDDKSKLIGLRIEEENNESS